MNDLDPWTGQQALTTALKTTGGTQHTTTYTQSLKCDDACVYVVVCDVNAKFFGAQSDERIQL